MNGENGTTDGTYDQLKSLITSGDVDLTGVIMHYTSEADNCIECHGCSGKGWVENSKGDLKICPICEGKGKLNKEKDCVEKDKERNSSLWYPWYPCYPCPDRTNDPFWPTYPIVTYCNVKTDGCTNCSSPK